MADLSFTRSAPAGAEDVKDCGFPRVSRRDS